MSSIIPASVSIGNPIDVVYVFRNTGKTEDVEMKYSLRSVKKNLRDYRKIWVVGESPKFLEDVCVPFELIPATDPFPASQHNVRAKLKKVLADDRVTDEFILMNDDFFFLSEEIAGAIPFFRQGTIPLHIEWRMEQEESPYVRALKAAKDALERRGLPLTDFECHIPILYDKAYLGPVLGDDIFDWAATYGMVIRSLYCNYLGIKGERCMDLKVDSPMTKQQLDRCFASCRFLSTGPGGLNPEMLQHLEAAFPAS